jgi:hypothetical protein
MISVQLIGSESAAIIGTHSVRAAERGRGHRPRRRGPLAG